MITIESTESIARLAADVFAFVSDVRNDPRWHTDVLEAKLTGGASVGKGSTFEIKMKPFMGTSEGTVRVAEYESPRRAVLKGRMGKMEPTTILTVAPDGAGSRVTRRIEMEPRGLLRLMAPFMGGAARKRNAGFLANLKRVLETNR
ncbi:MAG: SRPBCC family protein [Actinomycetota bacterium]